MQVARIFEHGGPEVMRVEEIDVPRPGPGEVLVRVLAVSVNHLDLWVRRGMPGFPVAMPRILGCDGTGAVIELGEGAEGPAPGTTVLLEPGFHGERFSDWDERGLDHLAPDYGIRGEHSDGLDAEYVCLPAKYLRPLPYGLDPIQTAATPLVFVTAYGMVVTRAALQADETILVLGGASGVGSAAIQIAKDLGARVIATAGSDAKRALASELGADHVVDHRSDGWAKEVRKLTDGEGANVVIEHVGPATWKGSMSALARLGRLVTCGGTTGPMVKIALPHLFIKNQTVMGSTMGPRCAFDEILAKLASGVYRPVVDDVMGLSEIRRAHERLEGRDVVGKLVLIPGQ